MKELCNRVLQEANYIIETNSTIRKAALEFNKSKSTIHKDISERLKSIDYDKFLIIEKIFKKHIDNRHINGGLSTKRKYMELKMLNKG